MADFDPDAYLAAATPANSFDPDAYLSGTEKPSSFMDVIKSAPRAVVSGIMGAASSLGSATAAESALTPEGLELAKAVPTGEEAVGQIEKNVTGPLPKPETALGRITSAGIETASNPSSLLLPGGPLVGAGLGFLSGAGGEAAAEAVPSHPTAARIAGSILAPTVASLVPAGVRAVKGAATAAGREAAAQTRAGAILDQRATDSVAFRQALDNPNPEIVGGSQPTTFQLTGDMGIGSLERESATNNPADFMERRAAQNEARLDALATLQATGAPEQVPAVLRSRLDAIDTSTQEGIDAALAEAQERATALGGTQPPEAYGEAIRGAVEPRTEALRTTAANAVAGLGGQQTPEVYGNTLRTVLQDAENSARTHERTLWNAVDPEGNLTVGMNPVQGAANAVYGDLSAAAEASLKPAERQIAGVIAGYNPVEPFRELTDLRSLVSSSMREELSTSGRTPTYARLSRLRGAIEGTIDGGVQDRLAQEAAAVSSGAMRPEDTIASRLQREANEFIARRSAETAANANVAGGPTAVSAAPRGEVPGGLGNAEGTEGVPPLDINFDQDAAQRLAEASAATRERAQTFGAQPIKPILRKEGQQGPYNLAESGVPQKIFSRGPGGFDNVSSFLGATAANPQAREALVDYAISSMRRASVGEDGLINPADFTAWQEKYQDALRALPEVAERVGNVAQASELIRGVNPLGNASNATLPSRFFHAGERGFEDVQRLRDLMGDETAQPLLRDYAARSLRQDALRPDGTIDPKKFAAWQAQHSEAMRAFPGLADQFSDAARATQSIADVAAIRKDAMDTVQRGVLGKLMGLTDSSDVTRTIGGILGAKDSVSQMRNLVAQVGKDPQAMEGLRKAIVDHITGKLISNTEAATSRKNLINSDQFQTFIKQNEPTLREVFKPAEVDSMKSVAADLNRANRSVTAVKLPGQSNTAQDMRATQKDSFFSKLLPYWGGEEIGRAIGSVFGWPGSAVGALAGMKVGSLVNSMRDAGIKRVNDLLKEALLNPEVAKSLLQKTSGAAAPNVAGLLAQRLARASMYATENANESDTTKRASGGKIEYKPVKIHYPIPVKSKEMVDAQGTDIGKTIKAVLGANGEDDGGLIKRAAGGRVEAKNIAVPTPAQAKVGNYAHDHLHLHGMPIAIETAKGMYRRGKDKDGKEWSVKMPAHYGRIKKTVGTDGDQFDVFIGPHPKAPRVWVIDQKDADTGKHNESKAFIGFPSKTSVITAYHAAFSDGRAGERLGAITEMSIDGLKDWLKSGDMKKPLHALVRSAA